MEKKLLKFVLAVLLCLPATSYGQLITIGITANVTNVSDSYNLLESKVSVGDTITGTYTYDTTPSPGYFFYSPPSGIILTLGDFMFATDTGNVKCLLGVIDNHQGQLHDYYYIESYNNLSLGDGVEVDDILWQIEDYSGAAISNATLPTNAPVLSDWDYNVLSITGGNGIPCDKTFSIVATVISAELVPEPMSILLFGFGLLALRKLKK
jgi:hypothetical protein